VLLVAALVQAAPAMAAPPPSGVQLTLEGCRNNGGITLPNGSGDFICPDSAYTSGNLGKGWNELDLVPYRLTTDAGNSAPASSTYTIAIVVDNKDAGHPGYDVLSVPVLNTGLSSASCTAPTVGSELIASPGLGGIAESRYRLVTITQAKNTTCVYDYYARLALGSHLFPGSSLHANLANENLSTAGIGARDVSIPVKEILPQELRKDMSASRNASHMWSVTKAPTPATLSFEDTCTGASPASAQVQITIVYERLAATPSGDVNILTHVYAKNPASRTITVNVTDQVYEGTTQTAPVGAPASSGPIDVPANTEQLVLTHMFTATSGANQFNDVATATYTDKVTGVPVPGQTTATAQATVQTGSTANTTATIVDVEDITGSNLSYSVDSTAPSSFGSFGSYVLGTKTDGPVTWTSPTLTGSGSVTFNKTVYVDQPSITSGTLHDEATLTGSDGFSTSATADVNISANALVSLKINKTIPNILQGGESETFDFNVYNASNILVASPSISFAAGETSKSITVSGLAPGKYTVKEVPKAGWATQPDATTTITLPTCSGEVSFTNLNNPAAARVKKVTVPAGNEAGWTFTLDGPGTGPGGESKTTSGAGFVTFDTVLEEGNYTITETLKDGWDQTGASAECSFEVNYPADSDRVFSCTYTNTQRGKIIVVKQTDPDGSTQSFEFDPSYGDNFFLSDGQENDSGPLVPGSYSVTETVPAGWDLTKATCDNGDAPGAIGLGAGETVTCTFENTQRGKIIVTKVTDPTGSTQSFDFTANYDADGFSLKDGESNDSGNLDPGTYSVSENVPSGWDLTSATCDDGSSPGAIGLGAGETVTCTFNNRQDGKIIVVKQTNPDGSSQSFEFDPSYGPNFNLTDGQSNDSGNLDPGTYSVAEVNIPSGWDLVSKSCDDGSSPGAIGLGAGETVTCTFTNRQRGKAKVIKTVSGAPPSGGQAFTFQLRQGASSTDNGTTLETLVANAANGGVMQFTTQLVPGTTYQMCEIVMPGWLTSLGDFVPNSFVPPDGVAPNPNVDNSILCVDFTVAAGETKTFTVDNTPPPGGRALTIGFWKNWSSCSGGKQKPVLDQTLASFPIAPGQTTHGVLIGDLYVDTCQEAVRILNKSTTNNGTKKASDPAFNLAAQLLAAKLNVQAGAGVCPAATTAINQAQALLDQLNFNGVTHGSISSSMATTLNNLASTLDNYNNNNLC
jgi:hypothetical protein